MFESYYLEKGKEASAMLRAQTVMKYTSEMGDYYYNVGVQDLTAGLDFIQGIEKDHSVYFLSSNLYDVDNNELLFKDHVILDRNGLKVGIFGVTREIQLDAKNIKTKNYVDEAKRKIEELRPQVDILVMLLNATQRHYQSHLNEFSDADYIFTSLEDAKTRPEVEQPIGKPFEYKLGIQGKNIGRCDINIADKNKPIRDVSSQMMMADIFSQRLSKLQEKDPKKKIEDIYKNSPNVLATVERLRKGIESANSVLNNTKNRSSFTFIPLSRSVASEKNILKEVDKVLDTCKKLDEKGLKLTS